MRTARERTTLRYMQVPESGTTILDGGDLRPRRLEDLAGVDTTMSTRLLPPPLEQQPQGQRLHELLVQKPLVCRPSKISGIASTVVSNVSCAKMIDPFLALSSTVAAMSSAEPPFQSFVSVS